MERETATLQEALSESREQLLRDPLTGAHSRVAFEETMARELARFRRSGERCVLAVLDIDHFKRINDTSSARSSTSIRDCRNRASSPATPATT
jgi:GGDEF domain-containing protein